MEMFGDSPAALIVKSEGVKRRSAVVPMVRVRGRLMDKRTAGQIRIFATAKVPRTTSQLAPGRTSKQPNQVDLRPTN